VAQETYESCCILIRQLLGDDDEAGGDIFTNEKIRPAFNSAWDELMLMQTNDQVPAAERIWFHTLPANTAVLYPEQASITDLGSLVRLEERPVGTSTAITGAVTDSGAIKVTATAHGLTGTPEVFVEDVAGVPANGRFFADVVDANNLRLRGSIFSGTYTSGGFVTTNTGRFTPVNLREDLNDRAADDLLREYQWREGAFQFVGATNAVQLRITYRADGTAPVTGSLIYQGIKNSLAWRAASILASSNNRGAAEVQRLDVEARGPELDGHAGHYWVYLSNLVRQLQRVRFERPVRPPEHLESIYYPTSW